MGRVARKRSHPFMESYAQNVNSMRNGVIAEMAATSATTLCMEIPKTAATTTYMTAD